MIDIDQAIEKMRIGEMMIVVDDMDRENEGDLVMAAECVTAEAITFMANHGRGLICLPMTAEKARALQLPPMVEENQEHWRTAFTVSIDAREGVSTGISAKDRCRTIRAAARVNAKPTDLVRPGHVFPLEAVTGGVLKRAGHTEAAVDLARLAGLEPMAVICEIIKDDGTMARMPDLEAFAEIHQLPIVCIADLIAYRRRGEQLVRRLAETTLPSRYGSFRAVAYEDVVSGEIHLALVKGDVSTPGPVLARMHSECLTGDVLGSLRCDCGEQLQSSLRRIEAEGRGVLVYLRQEGRGIGLGAKIQAYALQEQGLDTVEANERLGFPADLRDYGIGAQILTDLGIRELDLMTNNPKKIAGLEGHGLTVHQRVAIEVAAGPDNRHYLETKKTKLGHIFSQI
ncbi:MAG: bifunctional 3,4-dihydroxy-2-butanone-4-phosphate synthase/GTP cyclohydrolase II [Sulfobacillus sp.]